MQRTGKMWISSRDGISAGKKFRISDDLFRIHLGRASILAKFRLILHQFRIIQDNSDNPGKLASYPELGTD